MHFQPARYPAMSVGALMSERWSLRKRDTRHWLLVRPGLDDEQPWTWRRLPGDAQGDWPPPPGLLHSDRVALVMPALLCSHFLLPAPPGLKRHEWPLLLEDQLQQPVEQVQVFCLSRMATHLQLLVVERARVEGWLADAQALGVQPEAVWAQMQLMPQALAGEVLGWDCAEEYLRVRGDAEGRQQWLVWPKALGELPEDWQASADVCNRPWPERWAALERLPSLLETRRKQFWPDGLFTPLQRRLSAAAALLGLCWAVLALVQFVSQVPVWKAQVQALTGPVSTVQQATRRLAQVQGEQADWRVRQEQLVVLEQGMDRWLVAQQDWGVASSHFDGRTWRLVLGGHPGSLVTPPPDTHWQGLAHAAGATASAEPSENGAQLTVRFDLGAQP